MLVIKRSSLHGHHGIGQAHHHTVHTRHNET